jgi:hypothetical protein
VATAGVRAVRSRELITSFECERPAVAGLSHTPLGQLTRS